MTRSSGAQTPKKSPVRKTRSKSPKKARASSPTVNVKRSSTKAAASAKKAPKVRRTPQKSTAAKKPRSTAVVVETTQVETAKQKTIALLSPYRFPLNVDQLAIHIARYTGIAFVVLGGFFTLFFSSHVFGVSGVFTAALIDATTSSTETTTRQNIDCSLEENFQLSECAESVDQTPAVTFNIGSANPVEATVRIEVAVSYAARITLRARNVETGAEYTLGKMGKSSDAVWRYSWDTLQYKDGSYRLYAYVENSYGGYEVRYDKEVMVDNTPDTQTVYTTGVSSDDSADVTDMIARMEDSVTSNGNSKFTVYASNAAEVTLYSYDPGGGDQQLLGRAAESTAGQWVYVWDTRDVDDGNYVIEAQIHTTDGQQYRSEKVCLIIEDVGVDGPVYDDAHDEEDDECGLDADDFSEIEEDISTIESESDVVEVEKETETGVVPVEESSEYVEPSIEVTVRKSSPLSGMVEVRTRAEGLRFVEIYAIGRYSATKKFLGLSSQISSDTWVYQWDTTQLPNGEYTIIANAKSAFGLFEGKSSVVTVSNERVATYTQTQQNTIDAIADVNSLVQPTTVDSAQPITQSTEGSEDAPVSDDLQQLVRDLFTEFSAELDAEFQRLASALRSKDDAAVTQIKDRIELLKEEIHRSALSDDQSDSLREHIDRRLTELLQRVERDVEKSEQIIRERVGQEALADSDGDGITDFDEVNIYGTDPFSADTDGDGFIDGAEVLGGFDPTDATAQAAVAFESPREAGVVREDILQVHTVTTAAPRDDILVKESPQAIISGVGLPNSYVTLYIFSTPVIVTVKTDEDGSWSYRFDKELEVGEHEVFVGVTDNAGRIIAKSNPFRFVKEAQAFTPAQAQEVGTTAGTTNAQSSSLFSLYAIYLVVSIAIVAIGLLLILIGFYLNARKDEEPVSREALV